jgi:cell wall-associated NlpC family hydrolase
MTFEYAELIGRPFVMGSSDCIGLVTDFYKENFDISITNYARPKDWDADRIDIIGLTYEREGFDKVMDWTLKNLKPGDLLAMAVGSSVANHLAVYVGNNTIVHHLAYSMSREETLRDFWRKSTCYVLRHKDVHTEEVVKPTVTIAELMDARYNLITEE